jgi:hypothetical protein
LNKLGVLLEELKNKVEYERLSEDKNLQNIRVSRAAYSNN